MRTGPSYPHARRKGRLKGAVSRNNRKKGGPRVGAPLHTLSKLYNVPVGFVSPLPLLILRLRIDLFAVAAKGGCCSISDDLSWSYIDQLANKSTVCFYSPV